MSANIPGMSGIVFVAGVSFLAGAVLFALATFIGVLLRRRADQLEDGHTCANCRYYTDLYQRSFCERRALWVAPCETCTLHEVRARKGARIFRQTGEYHDER